MSDRVLSADGGDRIDNHHLLSCSRVRGNGRARLEVSGCPIQTDEKDICIEMTVKRCKRPRLHKDLESQDKMTLGRFLCIRAEVVLNVGEYAPHAIIMDDSTEPGVKDELRINVSISPKLYPMLYALLKPLPGKKRSEMLQLLASSILKPSHGR